MKKLGKQDVLNKVWKHLRTQGVKCYNDNTYAAQSCAYRSSDMKQRCAIGALFPNRLYSRQFEGALDSAQSLFATPISTLKKRYKLDKSVTDKIKAIRNLVKKEVSPLFLAELQSVHDDWSEDGWEDALKNFAIDNNLEPLPND